MNSDEKLSWLIDGHLRGELSAEEKAELAEMLDSSTDAQRRFVELAEFETALTEAQSEPRTPVSLERIRILRMGLLTAPWVIALVCLLVAFWPNPEPQDDDQTAETAPETNQEPSPVLAVLVDQAGANSANRDFLEEVRFEPGWHELEDGLIHLRFANGVDLLIESPAQFEILDDRNIHLEFGTIRVMVPPPASGFTVSTRNASFKDIGTEFGLKVDRTSGADFLFVFEGRVDVHHPTFNEQAEIVRDGQFWNSGDGGGENRVSPASFPTPAAVGHRRWLSGRKSRLDSQGLIAYYDFEPQVGQPTVLHNLVHGGPVSDAQIHGARWVSGRWPGKTALLFDSDTDFAELEVAGEFEELTITAWVFMNRIDHPLNAIFNSNGWDDGDVHLQIQRSGAAYSDLANLDLEKDRQLGRERRFEDLVQVQTGSWNHIAATFSRNQVVSRVFMNGEQAFEAPLDPEVKIRPGTCRIGNWLATGEFAPVRALNGRMDELAIWSRVLTSSEIHREVRQGRPTANWPATTQIP